MNLLKNIVLRRAAILCIFLLLRSQGTTAGYATLASNMYSNIVVAISKDLGTSSNVVNSNTIRSLFSDASKAIFNATGNRVYFGDITLVGPSGTISNLKAAPSRQPRASANQWQPPVASFESADIRIDTPNDAYGDYPYTQQSRGCGEPGDFIHLTLGFVNGVTNSVYDPAQRGKMLANEWIKYRYGVFDENGYSLNKLYPQMYYGTNGDKLYNTCNNSPVTWDSTNNICTGTSSIQGLSDSCSLKPDSTASENSLVNTSMMSAPSISLATQYCTNSSSHNTDAPNKQNYLCNGKSIMEIVLSHPDFANNLNQPIPDSSYKDLQVSQITTKKLIALEIIIDPMEYGQTKYTVKPALQKFVITELPIDSYFGITENTDPSKDIVTFTVVTTNQTKTDIASNEIINIDSKNSTNIKINGLVTTVTNAIESKMNVANENQYTKAILLLSDNVASVDLSTICGKANSSGIQLHLVTYNPTVFQYFKDIGSCPGQVFLIQAEKLLTGPEDLKSCYSDLQRRAQLQNVLTNLPSTILPDFFEKPAVLFEQMYMQSTQNGTFYVDLPVVSGDVGFFIDTCENEIYGTSYSPPSKLLNATLGSTGVKYKSVVSAFIDVQTINAGQTYWNFTVSTLSPQPAPYIVYAVGQPFTQPWSTIVKTPFVVKTEGWILPESQMSTWTKIRLFASVKNGTTPIFNAKVTAKILYVSNQANYTVVLRDDGSGNPDINEQDGIYSAYFTQFVSGGKYSVTITVTDNDGAANYPTSQYPSLTPNTNNNKDMGVVYTTPFQRTIEAGSFTATGQPGNVPPGSITNFHVKSISGKSVTVAWTAPGLQLDYGTVYKYIFNCDTNRDNLASLTKLNVQASTSNVPQANPDTPGTLQTTTFTGLYDQTVHYCAMQAFDRTGTKYGARSNIISYYLISDSGLSTAAIAGVVVGVILGIILLIALIVLIWYCFARRKETIPPPPRNPTSGEESTKLKPIPMQAPIAVKVDARSNAEYDAENYQNRSRPQSTHSMADSHRSDYPGNGSDDEDARSNYSKHTAGGGMQTFQGRPVGIPVLPTNGESFPMRTYGSNPGLQNNPGEQFDSTYLMQNADVAVPQRLAKLATIEDVGEYHDRNILKGTPQNDDVQDYRNLPVYNYIVNKPAPPPRSLSSSLSSINNAGKNNTQV